MSVTSLEFKMLVDELGKTLESFRDNWNERLEDVERKVNKARVSGALSDNSGYHPEERKALANGIRSLIRGNQVEANAAFATVNRESKAMMVGVDSAGGYIVSSQLSNDVTRVALEVAPLLADVRTVNLPSGDEFEEPIDIGTAGAAWVGETTTRSETSTPDLGMFSVKLNEITARPKVTQKLIDLSDWDVIQWLSNKVGEKFAALTVDAVLNGNGVNIPHGILNYPCVSTDDATRQWGQTQYVPSGASGAFKAAGSDPGDCLITLVSKVKPQYRAGCKFYMNRATAAALRKLKDSQGRYLWQDSIQAGIPNSLLGYPVSECEQLPDIAANSLSIMFGNLARAYTVPRWQGIRTLVDPFTSAPYVNLNVYQRVGGAMNNSEAVKFVKFSVS